MPRLTKADFLTVHHQLRELWLHRRSRLANLTTREQRDLHHYFLPSKARSDEQLLEHRQTITSQLPSLPHRAGRALAKLESGQISRGARTSTRDAGRTITVQGVAKPKPNYRHLAKMLCPLAIELAQAEIRAEAEGGAEPGDSASGPRAA